MRKASVANPFGKGCLIGWLSLPVARLTGLAISPSNSSHSSATTMLHGSFIRARRCRGCEIFLSFELPVF